MKIYTINVNVSSGTPSATGRAGHRMRAQASSDSAFAKVVSKFPWLAQFESAFAKAKISFQHTKGNFLASTGSQAQDKFIDALKGRRGLKIASAGVSVINVVDSAGNKLVFHFDSEGGGPPRTELYAVSAGDTFNPASGSNLKSLLGVIKKHMPEGYSVLKSGGTFIADPLYADSILQPLSKIGFTKKDDHTTAGYEVRISDGDVGILFFQPTDDSGEADDEAGAEVTLFGNTGIKTKGLAPKALAAAKAKALKDLDAKTKQCNAAITAYKSALAKIKVETAQLIKSHEILNGVPDDTIKLKNTLATLSKQDPSVSKALGKLNTLIDSSYEVLDYSAYKVATSYGK